MDPVKVSPSPMIHADVCSDVDSLHTSDFSSENFPKDPVPVSSEGKEIKIQN